MDSSTRERPSSADAVEFVRYCYRRRKVGWPELYDEMCAVANRGLYRGWGVDELSAQGIGFSLFEMPALATLVSRVIAEEQALRISARAAVTATATQPPDAAPTAPAEPARAQTQVEPADAATPSRSLRFAGATAGA
jgi:hypothetical protein